MSIDVQQVQREFQDVKALRDPFEADWTEVEELVVPGRTFDPDALGGTVSQVSSSRRMVFDPTPEFANQQFAALLSSQLINPSVKWLEMRLRGMAKPSKKVREWLAAYRDRLLIAFNAPESNFYGAAEEFFLDFGGFGDAIMFAREVNIGEFVYFQARPARECYFVEDALGRPNTIYRQVVMTALVAAQFYGLKNLHSNMQQTVKTAPHTLVKILHKVGPRMKRRPGRKGPLSMPWESIHIDMENMHVIRESGFPEFPFAVGRFGKLAGEVYGRGPGVSLLPSERMVQRMEEVAIIGQQLTILPPILAPDDGVIGALRLSPGAITYFRSGLTRDSKPAPWLTGARPDIAEQFLQARRDFILRGFYLDPMEFNEPKSHVTVPAIMDKRDARFQRLTPKVLRLQNEFLSPLVDRVAGILERKGELPPPPAELEDGRKIDPVFASPAALAQLITEANQMVRFLSYASPMMQLDQKALLAVDGEKYIRRLAIATGVPEEIIRDESTVAAMYDALRQQQAQAQQLGDANAGAQAFRNFQEGLNAASER